MTADRVVASALVMMLRSQNIAARVVVGFADAAPVGPAAPDGLEASR